MRRRERILQEARRLAQSRANDAVRLAFLEPGEIGELEGMDLAAVTEFRRHGNGAVEIKFIDRLAVMRWLMESAETEPWKEFYQEARRKREEG